MTDIKPFTTPDNTTVLTFNQAQMDFMRAFSYQQRHGLSTTKAAIRARLRTWRQQQELIEQNSYEGATGVEID